MHTRLRRAISGMTLLGAVFMTANQAAAQMSVTAVGVGEWDTNKTFLLLAGLSASPGGMGVRPVFGVTAHTVSFESGPDDRNSVFSVRPYVGLRNNYEGGALEGTIGYAFTNASSDRVTPTGAVVVDRGDGVVVTGQWDYWGTGGPLGAQAIAAYNFGSESLWTRGRLTTRVGESGAFRAGGEVAYYTDDDFNVWQPGVVLEWRPSLGGGPILGFGVGRKFANEGDDATYFKVEVVLPLAR